MLILRMSHKMKLLRQEKMLRVKMILKCKMKMMTLFQEVSRQRSLIKRLH